MIGELPMPNDHFNDSFLASLLAQFEKLQENYTEEQLLQKLDEVDITKLYSSVMNDSVELTVNRFKNSVQNAVTENQKTYLQFEESHRRIWGNCLNISEMMYVLCVDAMNRYCEYCYSLEKEDSNNVSGKIYTFICLREICARACQQYLEVFTLVKDGLADGAFARWRSLYELSIIAQFIKEQGENVAKSFFDSSFNYDAKNYEWAKYAPCFTDKSDKFKPNFEEIQNSCVNVSDNWKRYYKSACKAVHAAPVSTFGRLSIHSSVPSNGIGRSIFCIEEPAIHAAVSLNIIICNFFGVFSCGDSLFMVNVINKWTNLIKEYYSKASQSLNQEIQNKSNQ